MELLDFNRKNALDEQRSLGLLQFIGYVLMAKIVICRVDGLIEDGEKQLGCANYCFYIATIKPIFCWVITDGIAVILLPLTFLGCYTYDSAYDEF